MKTDRARKVFILIMLPVVIFGGIGLFYEYGLEILSRPTKIVEVTRVVELPIEVTRVVEVPVEIEKVVEVPVEVTRVVEKTTGSEVALQEKSSAEDDATGLIVPLSMGVFAALVISAFVTNYVGETGGMYLNTIIVFFSGILGLVTFNALRIVADTPAQTPTFNLIWGVLIGAAALIGNWGHNTIERAINRY